MTELLHDTFFSYPEDVNSRMHILGSISTINEGLVAANAPELQMTRPAADVLPDIQTAERFSDQTNNFTAHWCDFMPNVHVSPEEAKLGRRPIPDSATFDRIMHAYKLISPWVGGHNADEKLEFIDLHIEELSILMFKKNNPSHNASPLYGVSQTHARRPAFWRLHALFPDLTKDLLVHFAQHNLNDAIVADSSILNNPEAKRRVSPSPHAQLVAYNVMRLLVDHGDGNITPTYLRG